MSQPFAVDEVLELLRAAAAADGVRPVSEETELRLQHHSAGGSDLVVRTEPRTPVAAGQQLWLGADRGALHVFDAQTQQRVD